MPSHPLRPRSPLCAVALAVSLVACASEPSGDKGGPDTAGSDTGPAVALNTAPSVSLPTLSPGSVFTDDTLTVDVVVSDAEEDPLTVTYDWMVDGSSVQSGPDDTLSGATHFDKGQSVTVAVTADDGEAATTMTSAPVTVQNTAPTAPEVAIRPGDPATGDDLVCEVTTPSADADGDPVAYTMTWTVDGADYAGARTTTWTGDTADGADSAALEEWACAATPSDGAADGPAGVASVEVVGSEPGCWLDFDGTDDFVEIPDDAAFDLTGGDYTIEMWVFIDTASRHGAWVSKRGVGAPSGYTLSASAATAVNLSNGCCGGGSAMYFNSGSADTWSGDTTLSAGWHHVAVTRSASSSTSTFWLDGAFLGSSTVFGGFGSNDQTLWFAREHVNTGEFSRGALGGVHLADAILYTDTFRPTWPLRASASTQALWDMTTDTGSSLVDDSGTRTGVISGASWGGSCR